MGEVIITPFALAFNNTWCIALVTIYLAVFITKKNAELDSTNMTEITREQQIYTGLLYIIHCVLLMLVTTVLKRLGNRDRPENPNDLDPKPRSCRRINLRQLEHNKSMPSGDAA